MTAALLNIVSWAFVGAAWAIGIAMGFCICALWLGDRIKRRIEAQYEVEQTAEGIPLVQVPRR